ncbi:thioredoxin family protein [Sphingobacterium sp. N143]|uniref:thioredoxin family protein n=1 Tax=Sphingobacterium sp. N143 TaxID=2746727 RepID=UPI0025759492|nr:thioredoxin family protein [Sphingobacterium sp. N143]MDM1293727.1 thioredoxin family protein [Sphingobacterium sp. N143]
MTFEEYLRQFEDILNHPEKYPAYLDEEYYQYTKMNWARMGRWLKRFEPTADFQQFITTVSEPQHWIIITEPWCGDAAHSVPMLAKMAAKNPNITLDIQLRDSAPFLIESYLTNGGKSIPILVIRNQEGQDMAVWGPRPAACQQLFLHLKGAGKEFSEIKEEIQKWYNTDKGAEIQQEIQALLTK